MKMIRLFCVVLFVALVTASYPAIRVDGTDDRACYVHAVTNFNTTNQITVSLWYLLENGSPSGGELVTKGRTVNGNKANYHIRHNSSKFEFYFAAPDATFQVFATSATFTQTNVWRHLLFRFTYGVGSTAQFWVDGTNAVGTWTTGNGNTAGLTNAEPLHIGLGATIGFRGQIDEVAGWNVMLTNDEVFRLAKTRMWRTPMTVRRDSQMFYYPMRGIPFTTASGSNSVQDLGPFRSNGTPLNSPQYRPNHLASP